MKNKQVNLAANHKYNFAMFCDTLSCLNESTGKIQLQSVIQLVSDILVLWIIHDSWVSTCESILPANVQRIVDFPVNVANFSRWMKQALEQKTILLVNK